MDESTWQDSVTAWATVGAVVVALGLGLIAEFRNARDRSARRKEDGARRGREEAAQANRVSAWLADRPAPTLPHGGTSTPQIFVVAQNASTEPVWEVIVLACQIERLGEDEVGTAGASAPSESG